MSQKDVRDNLMRLSLQVGYLLSIERQDSQVSLFIQVLVRFALVVLTFF
jgi:hypothetical protein